MARLRYNLVRTTLAAGINDSTTTITFDGPLQEGGVDIPTVEDPDTLALRIGGVEIVTVTAYTEGATTATVARGADGTAAAAHDEGAEVAVVATKEDFGPTSDEAEDLFNVETNDNGSLASSWSWTTLGPTTLDTLTHDPDWATWNTTDSRVEILEDGLYVVQGILFAWSASALTGHAQSQLRLTGPTVTHPGGLPGHCEGPANPFVDDDGASFVEMTRYLYAGAHIQLLVRQNGGNTADTWALLTLRRVR